MDIEDRIRRLEAKEAIRKLRYEYASTVDTHNWDRFITLFTEDATIEFPQQNVEQTPFIGRDEIESFGRLMDELLTFSAHMMHNPLIDVDGDEASGIWYVAVPEVTPDGPVLIQGRYEDQYRCTSDGWKFDSTEIYYDYRVSPDEGWDLNAVEEWRGRDRP
ncbi:nuclear transport factor 2 family protein [Halosolutus amylolyticus]|uniref:Nuclear transport factor 2 family protein n=1 Tax=Halosolutus amylolyticus TaxID=2932267 RepID=A0ABD5PJY6_9EURY|nr:nuclear transport factor 2 family protein [Halosolutus amylolyticus]